MHWSSRISTEYTSYVLSNIWTTNVTDFDNNSSIRIPFKHAPTETLSKLVRSPCDLAGVLSLYEALYALVPGEKTCIVCSRSLLILCHSRSCMWYNSSYVFCRRFVLMMCEKSLATLRHSICTIVHNEPQGLRNVVRYTGGRLVVGCYEFDRENGIFTCARWSVVLTLVTLWSVQSVLPA